MTTMRVAQVSTPNGPFELVEGVEQDEHDERQELAGTEVARVTITESTAISCAGGPQQTLNDSSCLPPFSLTECAAGDCQ